MANDSAPENGGKASEFLAQMNELSHLIVSMSGWNIVEAKTIVYWCISTYGYDKLQKFPVLVIFGQKSSGKTTALKMIMSLVKTPPRRKRTVENMVLQGGFSEAINRDMLAHGGTHLVEESDEFDEKFVNNVFDKFNRNITVNERSSSTEKGWKKIRVKVSTALAMHKRKPFKDEATDERCIQLRTRKVDLGMNGRLPPNIPVIADYLATCEEIAKTLSKTWEEVPDEAVNRETDKWNPIRHVAEKLGDTDFAEYVSTQIRNELELSAHTLSDETDVAVFRSVLAMAHHSSSDIYERVQTSEVKNNLKIEGIDLTSQNINKMARVN